MIKSSDLDEIKTDKFNSKDKLLNITLIQLQVTLNRSDGYLVKLIKAFIQGLQPCESLYLLIKNYNLMKKRVEIVMLPTEKAQIYKENEKLYFNPTTMHIPVKPEPQHLYFISDDEIKDRDWCYDNFLGLVFQFEIGEANSDFIKKHIKKIIATTDEELNKDLIYDGEYFDSEFKKGLPRPSKEFLKKYCELGGIDKVLVEYDCDHSQMPNKVIDILKVAPDNTITIYPIN